MLAAARVLLGLTQAQVAAEAGVNLGSLSRYESGASQLRSDTVNALLGVFRRHGIRFLAEQDGVSAGVVLMAARADEP